MSSTKFETYSKYKISGFKWLGKIPEHWELERLGKKLKERKVKVSDKDYPPLSVTKQGILPQIATAAKSNDGENRKLVRKGDFVINSRSDRKGSSGIAKTDGSVSLINIVLKLNGIFPNYCNYLLKSNSFVEEFYRMGHGIVADLWTTRYDEMKNIKTAFPPKQEQTRIANFLDRKCEQIDKAIELKQRLIELLKERRQIIIQNAVTRGLKPNVKLKDSGVEWIGKIPEHWEVKRLKYITFLKSGETISYGDFTEDGYPVYGGNGFRGYTTTYTNEGEHILIGRQGALCGNINYAKGKFFASEHAIVVYPLNNESILWLGEAMDAANLNRFSQSAAQPGIAVNIIKNEQFPYPPLKEQYTISKYLEKQFSKITKAVNYQQTQIDKLKEYKSVLIDSAVTGKIKVS